jgi:hypothetical protein
MMVVPVALFTQCGQLRHDSARDNRWSNEMRSKSRALHSPLRRPRRILGPRLTTFAAWSVKESFPIDVLGIESSSRESRWNNG